MADSETQQPVDLSQQVTSQTPAKWPKQKNPKQVAAGKAIAEKTRQASEAQKKALVKAQSIIANNQVKQAAPPVVDPPAAVESESTINVLTTAQWLSGISIFVSLVGIYYKRQEIKVFLNKKPSQSSPPQENTPPPAPVEAASKRKGGIRPMD